VILIHYSVIYCTHSSVYLYITERNISRSNFLSVN